MMRTIALVGALLFGAFEPAAAQTGDGVIFRCGASSGHAYYFKDQIANPTGPNWAEDGLKKGKIVLVKLGDEWDIQFDDIRGAYGYRQDGAKVFPVMQSPGFITVGAFNTGYVDLYTFDLKNHEVAWSSNKLGPVFAKVAVYRASCD